MRKSALTRLVEAVVWFFLVAAALVELSLPFMIDVYLNWASDFYVAVPYYRAFILVFLMLSTACFLWILAELALIFRTIGKDPFVARNVGALKRMGWVEMCIRDRATLSQIVVGAESAGAQKAGLTGILPKGTKVDLDISKDGVATVGLSKEALLSLIHI